MLESSLAQSITLDVYINANKLQELKDKGFDISRPIGIESRILKDCASKDLNLKIPMAKLLSNLKPNEFKQIAPLIFYKDPSLPQFDYTVLHQKTQEISQNYQKATANRPGFEAGLERFGQKLSERINQDPKLFNIASEHPGGVKGYVEMQKRIAWEVAEYQACAGISLQDSLTQIINANSQPGKVKGLLENLSPKKMFQNEQQRDDLLTGRYNFNFTQTDSDYVLQKPANPKAQNEAKKGSSQPYAPPKEPISSKGM